MGLVGRMWFVSCGLRTPNLNNISVKNLNYIRKVFVCFSSFFYFFLLFFSLEKKIYYVIIKRRSWCNGYRCEEIDPGTRLFAFQKALIFFRKV